MTRPTVADRKCDGPGRSGCCKHCRSCDGILLVWHDEPCSACVRQEADDDPVVQAVPVAGLVAPTRERRLA